ncbi:MAG: glycine cleavage system aminomethyltransferase GcvT [Candidatus Poribacteria bacterium]|nr:glycine cleavage system aminomethyltransferase GcvT [Candidatus Poribacteria bacterium]
MKRTPLYEVHKSLYAKFTEFGGWEMPLQYTSIVKEHLAVRNTVGLFDLSHMGEIDVKGQGANELVQKLCTNDVNRLIDGQVQYTLLCNENGGIVDDILIYRHADNDYTLVVNAANIEKDFTWIKTHNDTDAEVSDTSDDTVLIALQGPRSVDVLYRFTPENLVYEIKPFQFCVDQVAGSTGAISRTGYTGELGFELYVEASKAENLWNILYPTVIEEGGQPVGLGARDTLRLEAGLRLYGMDMDENTTPFEAGLGRFVKLDKDDFIGKDVLLAQKEKGDLKKKLVGFQMLDRAVARCGYDVYQNGNLIGKVTSGAPSPSLKCNIGFASISPNTEKSIEIDIRGELHPAKIVKVPFI